MLPALTSEVRSADGLHWTFIVPQDAAFFGGHFPGHPVLPGVVALSWLLAAAERWCGAPLGAVTLLNVKFQSVIQPGARLDLSLKSPSAGHLQGIIRSEAGVHATALIPVPVG